ncbi:ArsA-related P-loop ATPase [Nocardiopsis sp. CNT312]|uniref:ArsA-related P-loop ATPase n=1 Tax=Nocardiopsis sp. CNT312 TaxID=1137268 RepID=UPI00048F2FF0|nr:ArsA-related P-loop ATPase [Nocardiopsis sp. CNT312]
MSEAEFGRGTRARLHIVTGKGGTGKTTAATALALALAAEGGRVLLVEVEGRQGIAGLLGRPPLPPEERELIALPGGGRVCVLAADAEAALLEYLAMFYGMGRAGRALTRLGVVDFATTVAPGLRDVLLTGKATEAARRRAGDRRGTGGASAAFHYDAVVMDAPPTGRIGPFLNVNSEVAGLARVGPVRSHADKVMDVIRSERTLVHFVTLLEEMPVQECKDGIAEIEGLGLHAGSVFVNMVRPPLLGEDDLATAADGGFDGAALVPGLAAAGLADVPGLAAALSGEVRSHALRAGLERRTREDLAAVGRPVVDLPYVEGGVAWPALERLADALKRQGTVR